MIAPTAPAFIAWVTLVAKVSVPRWMRAMFPETPAGNWAAAFPVPQLIKVAVRAGVVPA